MAKHNSEFRTQTYDIGDDATVTIRYHKDRRPRMIHNDRSVFVGDDVPMIFARSAQGVGNAPTSPQTNGPEHDTPEIIAAKANLQSRFPKPLTTAQVWRDMGLAADEDELTPENLAAAEAAMAGGAVV